MRPRAPFQADDLAALDSLLRRATWEGTGIGADGGVVAMETIAAGCTAPTVIGLRHDVDNEMEPALAFARWEAERGYRSTYFLLHSASYWNSRDFRSGVHELLELGHEIGIHNNAIAEHVRTGRDPHDILAEAIETLRARGAAVTGTVAHGDSLCREIGFVNDEIFADCVRQGNELRLGGGFPIGRVTVERRPLASYGLTYDSNWLPRGFYASDSGGVWQGATDRVPGHDFTGQLHLLIHPCWWTQAF